MAPPARRSELTGGELALVEADGWDMVRFGVGSCALLWLPRRVRIAHSDISLARFTTVWHDLSLPPTRQLRAADVHPIFFATLRVNYSTLTPLVTFFLHFLILLFAPPKHVFNYHRWSDSCPVFFRIFISLFPSCTIRQPPFLLVSFRRL